MNDIIIENKLLKEENEKLKLEIFELNEKLKKYTKLGPFMPGSTQKPSVGKIPARESELKCFTVK